MSLSLDKVILAFDLIPVSGEKKSLVLPQADEEKLRVLRALHSKSLSSGEGSEVVTPTDVEVIHELITREYNRLLYRDKELVESVNRHAISSTYNKKR